MSHLSTEWKVGDRVVIVEDHIKIPGVIVGKGAWLTEFQVRDATGRIWVTHWAWLRSQG